MMHKSALLTSSSATDARIVKTDMALRAGLLALLQRRPFDQITMREIAAEAGVHYTTFYRHHPTKEALLDHVAADQIARLVELVLPVQDAFDTRAGLVALCVYVAEHRTLWASLLTGGAAGVMREELMRASRAWARQSEKREGWMPLELITVCSVTTIVEALSWWLSEAGESIAVEEIAEMIDVLIAGGTSGKRPAIG